MDGEKPQKVPPFSFFRHCEIFSENYFLSKGSPFNFFDILQHIGCLKIPKGPPFQFFGIETFFRKFVFSPKGSSFNCNKNVDKFGRVPLLARQGLALAGPGAPLSPFFCFSKKKFDKISKKNVKVFFQKKSFALFEPQIWRRL